MILDFVSDDLVHWNAIFECSTLQLQMMGFVFLHIRLLFGLEQDVYYQ